MRPELLQVGELKVIPYCKLSEDLRYASVLVGGKSAAGDVPQCHMPGFASL